MATETVSKALELWNNDQATKAGWLLYEHIPLADRPFWAARILDLCRSLTQSRPEVDAVYEIATRPADWHKGHDAFRNVRRLTIHYESAEPKNEVYGGLLYLAENVAKVTYNATSPSAPFDHDAGAWVVTCLRYLVKKVNNPECFRTVDLLYVQKPG